ncbi:DUF4184 family protein [Streptomyces sp. NPDC003077]|uniref:DUF4184 family protein n=1 Tax=Streptomyces sp. NPDC003077 TaxID=3154443 RepID=UPI0033A2A182
MPFTLSHAAAVLPAMRRTGAARGPLIASALVAGSFAPDLTYFAGTVVPGAMLFGAFTHSPMGVLTVDVLITAALVGVWLLLREPLLALLPRSWRGPAYALARGRPWRTRRPVALAGWFFVSAVLGSVTHVVWDAFTHQGRWGTRLLPVLERVVEGFPLTTYVQYGTSALALGVIGWFLYSGTRRARRAEAGTGGAPGPRSPGVPGQWAGRAAARRRSAAPAVPGLPDLSGGQRAGAWLFLGLCLLAGTVHRVLRARSVYGDAATWFDYVPTVAFGAGAGLAAGLPLYALAVRALHRTPGVAATPGPHQEAGRPYQEPGRPRREVDRDVPAEPSAARERT